MKYKKIAFLFPGQGAQVVGMGKDFCDAFAPAREAFEEADTTLNRHLSKVIFEGPEGALTETKNSQCAIYLVSMAILRVLQKQFPDLKPTICAGLSLGEYTALAASGRFGFGQGLTLVEYRGACMQEACLATEGTMAALFGLTAEQVEKMVSELALVGELWVANYNAPTQIVISGTKRAVALAIEAAKQRGAKRAIPLEVHGAFHSGLMKSAQTKLQGKIAELELQESPIALVMNVPGNFVSEKESVRRYLVEQVTSSIKWAQSIGVMQDVDCFVEIGPGRTLAGLNRHIGVTAPTINVGKVADLENLATAMD